MVSLETINVGQAPNDRKGDQLRTAMQKVNLNFSALNEAIVSVFAPTTIPSGVDLNTMVTSGVFHQNTNAGAAAGTNYPTPYAGLLEVFSAGTMVYQFYTRFRAGGPLQAQYWRSLYQSTWSEWVEVASSQTALVHQGFMAASQNLDTYRTRGMWNVSTAAIAAGGSNFPIAQAGSFVVYAQVGQGQTPAGYVVQEYTAANANRTYTRVYSGTAWGPWVYNLDSSLLGGVNGVAQLGADSRLLPAQAPILYSAAVPGATDANTMVVPGVYYVNSDAAATAALNWPEQLAGTLNVEQAITGNAQVTQTYTTRNGTGGVSRTYKRVRFGTGGGTWGTWQQLARFDDAMTHTFLTVATDANTLVADNTFYTWRSGVVVTGGSNWAPVGTNVSGGSLEVRVTAADMIIQTATFLVGSNKPRIYQRFGSGTAWQAWKIISAVSSVTWLPTADAGDVYVDGLGWHSWNGTAYALTSLATVLPTAAHDLNTYTTPGSYRQTTNAGAAAGTNYPSPLSGYLEVVQGVSGSCKQEYTISSASNATLTAGPRKFWRMQTGASTWSPWQEVLTVAMGLTQQTVAAAADANTLSAVNTQYVWTNGVVVNGGTNWPALGWSASRGFLEVVAMSGTQVFQRLVLLLAAAAHPVVYERFGNVGGTWYGWRIAGPISSTSYLPTADYGDVYVDGLGWYFWNGTSYVATPLANARVTALESQMFGRGQSWVDMSGQRGGSTNYTNSTGRPIIISLTGVTGADALLLGRVNGILMGRSFIPGSIGGEIGLSFVVPPGDTYRAEWGGINTIFWAEYR